jgi:error-prone DNA polymerase
MSLTERLQADFTGLELTTGTHPMALVRPQLPEVWPAADLPLAQDGERLTIAGSVICRQRPGTGKLQNQHGVIHVKAETIDALVAAALPAQASHDFR